MASCEISRRAAGLGLRRAPSPSRPAWGSLPFPPCRPLPVRFMMGPWGERRPSHRPSASARRRALRAAALRRLRAGTVATPGPGVVATDASLTAEVASAVAGHHAALLRLVTRALDAYA
eukprot:805014-Alexandrium_andersonii.AAC.1